MSATRTAVVAVDARAAALAIVSLASMTPARLDALLARWPDPRDVVRAIARRDGEVVDVLVARSPLTGARAFAALTARWSNEVDVPGAQRVLVRRGTHVLLAGADGYPIREEIPRRPAVLLAEGPSVDVLVGPRVAIVGTRAASLQGLDDARQLGRALAESGCSIVSGMAIGIDAAAHEGALDAGGVAIGVLATGLDVVYPRRHRALFDRVRASGLLVSESAFGTTPEPTRFPVRNRIIAAMADVVVVVEATIKGGARITAERALEYGRPLFAMPGSRRNPAAAGCNALLADGAHPLLDPSDVLLAVGMTEGCRRGWAPRRDAGASEDARACVRACGGEPATTDQLAARTGLDPTALARALAECQRMGLLRPSRGFLWPV